MKRKPSTLPHPPPPPQPPAREPAQLPRLQSLEEIQAACREKIDAVIRTPRGPRVIEVRPLTPAQSEEVARLIESVFPPYLKDKDGLPTDRLDIANEEYQRRKQAATRKARAIALYWAVPAFAAGRPGLSQADEIHQYMGTVATDGVLEQLWSYVASDFLSDQALEEQVHFFTPPA